MFPAPMWEIFYGDKAREHGLPSPGTLTISITEVTRHLLCCLPVAGKQCLVDDFSDTDDLTDALLATAAVPWLLTPGFSRPFRGGQTLDGGMTNNTPHFRDGKRPQLIVSWDQLDPDLRARTAGIYFRIEELLELAKLGVDAAYALGRSEPAQCVALIPENAPSESLPPAVFRAVATVNFFTMAWVAISTYCRPVERRWARQQSESHAVNT